jgi:hypothetical protein
VLFALVYLLLGRMSRCRDPSRDDARARSGWHHRKARRAGSRRSQPGGRLDLGRRAWAMSSGVSWSRAAEIAHRWPKRSATTP